MFPTTIEALLEEFRNMGDLSNDAVRARWQAWGQERTAAEAALAMGIGLMHCEDL